MEAKIQKQIIDYFSYFEEFHNTSKTCLKDCQNCAVAINKFITRCRKIKVADVSGSPFGKFDELQGKLCASLHNLISEEIREIQINLSTIEDLFEKLCIKHKSFVGSCENINLEDQSLLVKGSPFQPPLKQLLEFAEESLTFASQVCAQIETSLNILAFKGLQTEPLADNFKISTDWKLKITEILAYTSFCSENEI